ncbi:MAG: rhomboid family intramembrane serine protease [Phycisphaerae bacterium]
MGGGGGMGIGLPKPAAAVKILLILNGVGFGLQILVGIAGKGEVPLAHYLGATAAGWWQIWRYITFQFLHSTGGIFHIALNMLGLYMLGTPLEQKWGSKAFVKFYLSCGVCAGLAYVVMGHLMNLPPHFPLIGASGGVYGVVLACAVLFPHFRIIFLFFPVPIRLAAVVIFGGMILKVLMGVSSGQGRFDPDFWSQVAHLGGAVAAAVWIWVLPSLLQAREEAQDRVQMGAWKKKMQQKAREQEKIDRLLQKIHDEGIGSLTNAEKRFLQDTSRRQREDERDVNRL